MNSKNPLISIITPSYNQGHFLEETIRSVLLQDYPAIEYIVIDGGSTDDSTSIIEKYEDELAYSVSEPDGGQSDAINKGLRRATGEYVAWINSDDIYTENAISRAVEKLELHPDCGLVFSNVLSIDSDSSVFNIMSYGDWGLLELMEFKVIGQPGIFMRKSALDNVGYLEPDYHWLMDHHLWLKIAAMYPIKFIDDIWAAARFHPGAKNLRGAEKYGKEAFVLFEWMKNETNLQSLLIKNKNRIEAGAYLLQARYLLEGDQNWPAFMNYMKSVSLNPSHLSKAFKRIVFSLFNGIIPLSWIKEKYIQNRTNQIKQKDYDLLLKYLEIDNRE